MQGSPQGGPCFIRGKCKWGRYKSPATERPHQLQNRRGRPFLEMQTTEVAPLPSCQLLSWMKDTRTVQGEIRGSQEPQRPGLCVGQADQDWFRTQSEAGRTAGQQGRACGRMDVPPSSSDKHPGGSTGPSVKGFQRRASPCGQGPRDGDGEEVDPKTDSYLR
ncbi:hypothetical protein CB1_025668001 [Camelus ferus]|nr:hypothetical protein CB1_025668001 [Camelus ferus]